MIQSRTSRKITKYKIIYCKISSIYNIYTWFIMILDFVWPGNPIGTSENPKKNNREIPGVLNPTFSSHATACAKQQPVPSNSPKARHWRPRVERLRPRCPTQLHLGCWSWASWLHGIRGGIGQQWDTEWDDIHVYIYTHNIIQIYIYIRYNIYIYIVI